MAQQLAARVQHVVAVFVHAVNVIADPGETTVFVRAVFGFEELFVPIAQQHLVFQVVGFVFFCGGMGFRNE